MIYFHCYQCDKVAYLFSDSRCAECTRVEPDKEKSQDADET